MGLPDEPDYMPGSQDPKVTDEQIYDQIGASEGNKAHMARELRMSRSRLSQRIDRSAVLTARLLDFREDLVDHAEQNVFAGVRRGDATDSRFVLQTLGKSRGWAQGVGGEGKGGEIVVTINKLSEA